MASGLSGIPDQRDPENANAPERKLFDGYSLGRPTHQDARHALHRKWYSSIPHLAGITHHARVLPCT
jgi:hypothetical protein